MIKIQHPETGEVIDVADDTYTDVFGPQGYTPVDSVRSLSSMTRDELNAHAEAAGISDPASYPSKTALYDAIYARTPETEG